MLYSTHHLDSGTEYKINVFYVFLDQHQTYIASWTQPFLMLKINGVRMTFSHTNNKSLKEASQVWASGHA